MRGETHCRKNSAGVAKPTEVCKQCLGGALAHTEPESKLYALGGFCFMCERVRVQLAHLQHVHGTRRFLFPSQTEIHLRIFSAEMTHEQQSTAACH